jgi:hypothetical protein
MLQRSLVGRASVISVFAVVAVSFLGTASLAEASLAEAGVAATPRWAPALPQSVQEGEAARTVDEVEQAVYEYFRFMRESSRSRPESYSKHGSLEFWSSGGLIMEVPPGGLNEEFEFFDLHPKHITVITLVPEQAAVAVFYADGSLQPKGAPPVMRYLTRVTQVFVYEEGEWRVRSSHWSPLSGGAGTSQVSVEH